MSISSLNTSTSTNTNTIITNTNTNTTNSRSRNHNHTSYKNIVLTHHSRQRANERITSLSDNELKKLASKARFNSINLDILNIYNYQDLGITYEELTVLKKKYYRNNNSEKLFYSDGFIWIFFGKNALSLKSVVPFRK